VPPDFKSTAREGGNRQHAAIIENVSGEITKTKDGFRCRCPESSKRFSDIFADSRLVEPPKCLMHIQDLEAKVGIEQDFGFPQKSTTRYYHPATRGEQPHN
jgi:hypothetical protein